MNNTIADSSSHISSQIIEKLKNEATAHEICGHYRNGGLCDGWLCTPSAVDQFSKKLTENSIPHACIRDSKGEGNFVFVTRDSDRNTIRSIKDQVIAETKPITETSLDQLKAKNIGESIHTIRGVSEMYATVFKNEAKVLGMNTAVINNNAGTYDIYYSGKDRNKADRAIMETVVATRGIIGKFKRARINKLARGVYLAYYRAYCGKRALHTALPYHKSGIDLVV